MKDYSHNFLAVCCRDCNIVLATRPYISRLVTPLNKDGPDSAPATSITAMIRLNVITPKLTIIFRIISLPLSVAR